MNAGGQTPPPLRRTSFARGGGFTSLVLWGVPVFVLAWTICFLLTPEVHSLTAARDLRGLAALAGLGIIAWGAWKIFAGRGGCEHFEEGMQTHPTQLGSAILLCAALFPLILGQLGKSYWIHVGALSLIYVLLAVGLNIVVGFAGLLVLGFSAFYGIGAYVAAILTTKFPEMPHLIWLLIPLAAFLASLFGILLGGPTLRLRGDYLAIVTLGFGEIVRIVLTNWDSLTRGPIGISGVGAFQIGSWNLMKPQWIGPVRLDGTTQYYFLILMFVALGVVAARRLNQSRIGRAWVAFREDELAARSFGINASKYKVLAFAVASAYAGVAGVFFASLQGFVDPTSFSFLESVIIVCMVVLGGMGSLAGSMVAAFLLVMLPEKLQMLRDYRMLIFGLVMILLMIVRPQGLIPSKRRLLELRRASE